MMRQEVKTVWYDTFGEDMDEERPNSSASDCVIALLSKAQKWDLIENLLENIVLTRPDLADDIENF